MYFLNFFLFSRKGRCYNIYQIKYEKEVYRLKDSELTENVHSAVYHQCQRRGYVAPVDVLIEIGILPKQKYEEWRFGKIPYLEQVCTCNLRILTTVMGQIRRYAQKTGLKSSLFPVFHAGSDCGPGSFLYFCGQYSIPFLVSLPWNGELSAYRRSDFLLLQKLFPDLLLCHTHAPGDRQRSLPSAVNEKVL